MLNYGFLLEGVDGTQDNMASLENIIDNKVFGESGYDTDWALKRIVLQCMPNFWLKHVQAMIPAI